MTREEIARLRQALADQHASGTPEYDQALVAYCEAVVQYIDERVEQEHMTDQRIDSLLAALGEQRAFQREQRADWQQRNRIPNE